MHRRSIVGGLTASALGLILAGSAIGSPSSAGNSVVPPPVEAERFNPQQLMDDSRETTAVSLAEEFDVSVARMKELLAAQDSLHTVDTGVDPGFVQLTPRFSQIGVEIKYLTTSSEVPAQVLSSFKALPDVVTTVVTVPFTLEELAEAGMRSSEALDVPADSDLSPEDGSVVFVTARPVNAAVAAQVEAIASPVSVRWVIGELAKPLTGGGGSMSDCTGGFTVKVIGGTNEGISTAGHCNNYQPYTGSTLNTVAEAWGGNSDLQWMDNVSINWDPSVWLGGPSNWPVQSRKNWDIAGINDPMCWYGKVSGGGCGILLSRTHRPSSVPGASYSFGLSSVGNGAQGDSGGPVYNGATAWGLVGGGTSGNTWFTPHDRLETNLGVRVMIQ